MDLFLADLHLSYFLRMFIACICGTIFGIERQLRGKPFGIRACLLICLSTTLFVYIGSEVLSMGADSTRVVGQVVTGVGFLGAGAILQKGDLVIGITSAATIWMIAAVGAAIGTGHFGYGVMTTLIAVTAITCSRYLERKIGLLQHGPHNSAKPAPIPTVLK
jgi:putative Mg2+ transporter-C (MgtC) family protein